MGFITLDPVKSAVVSALLFVSVLSFTVTYYCLSKPFSESYWTDLRGEEFRKDLGFATGLIRIPGHHDANCAPLKIFGITRVAPGGSFAKAGVRTGDLPVALAIAGYGRACPKQWEWIRYLCDQYLGGPCLITGLAAADRQEQVGAMFYAALFEAHRLGHYRFRGRLDVCSRRGRLVEARSLGRRSADEGTRPTGRCSGLAALAFARAARFARSARR